MYSNLRLPNDLPDFPPKQNCLVFGYTSLVDDGGEENMSNADANDEKSCAIGGSGRFRRLWRRERTSTREEEEEKEESLIRVSKVIDT
ncbi:MAG: hypothetical protein Q9172_001072 [Xanthocarpia lactea]